MADQGTPPKFPVSAGLAEQKHRSAMGMALWTFLALIDWQTGEDGEVSYGKYITAGDLSARLGVSERTARNEIGILSTEGYIRTQRGTTGWRIWVEKPKKHFRRDRKDPSSHDRKDVADRKDPSSLRPERSFQSDRKDPSSLSSSLPSKTDLNNKQSTRARGDSISEIFRVISREHPKGHNPKPNLAGQLFLSKFDEIAKANECLRQHREKWRPAWDAGRYVPDLHTWVRDYSPDADVGVQQERRTSSQQPAQTPAYHRDWRPD